MNTERVYRSAGRKLPPGKRLRGEGDAPSTIGGKVGSMRLLHVFEHEDDAERLVAALFVEQIDASVREGRGTSWQLMVHDDDDLDAARALLARFEADPDDPLFEDREREAQEKKKAAAKEARKSRHRVEKARRLIDGANAPGYVTIGLIAFSVGLFFLDAARPEIGRALTIRPLGYARPDGGFSVEVWLTLQQTVASGEVWRLFAGTFLHGGMMHLGFNCLWLYSLGTMFERAHSSWRLLFFTLVFGTGGVIAEVVASGHPAIGLSGVVYGLFGYLWIRGKYDPQFAVQIPRSSVMWMVVWYVLGFGLLQVANGAHTFGLVFGAAGGFLSSGYIGRQLLRK